jgi:hypothetical protein
MTPKPNWTFTPSPIGDVGAIRLRRLSDDTMFPERTDITAVSDVTDLPLVRLRFEVDDGRPVCTEIAFNRGGPGFEIRAATVRQINVGGLIDQAIAWQTVQAQARYRIEAAMADESKYTTGSDGMFPFWTAEDAQRAEQAALSFRRQRSVDEGLLREVADVYSADTSGQPTVAVKNHFIVSKRTATRWVSLARERNFLSPYVRPRKEA